MHRPVQSLTYMQESQTRFDAGRVYGPMLWIMNWLLRAVLLGRGLSQKDCDQVDMSGIATFSPSASRNRQNRQIRRATLSGARRIGRQARKGRWIDPHKFIPRAYAHVPFLKRLPDDISCGQFVERYARQSGLGRVRVLGLSMCHRIGRFMDVRLDIAVLFAALDTLRGKSSCGLELSRAPP